MVTYVLTLGVIISWLFTGIFLQGETTPTQVEKITGLVGLLFISIVISIEGLLAHKNH